MTRAMAASPAQEASRLEEAFSRCAAGDRDALRMIYEWEAPRMLGMAQRILKRRALAEEAVHDAFLQIWRKAATFDPKLGSVRSWIYAVLRNRALNILRDRSRADAAEDPQTPDPASADDPEALIARLSEAGTLRRCLEQLEPKRRAAIVLAYTQGLSHSELARRLGMPLATAQPWIRESLAALKERLG